MHVSPECTTRLVVAALCVAAVSAAPAARAGLDVAFDASVQLGDDAGIYVAVSSRYFDRDAEEVRHWERQYGNPDDLAVAMFICRYASCSPDRVYALRMQGLTWWEVGVRLGVPVDAWFVPVRHDPSPPYGKAYGHWKKHRKQAPERIALGDVDARNLVAVRLLHEYYGVSVEVAMDWRASGRDLERLAAGEYRNRHGRQGAPARAAVGGGGATGVGGDDHGQAGGRGKAKK